MLVLKLIIASLAAATASASAAELTERLVKRSNRDVKIPPALVARVEKQYQDYLRKLNRNAPATEKYPVRRTLLHMSVEMTQRRVAALHDDLRVLMPVGGGIIDLAEFVTPVKGGFWVRIFARRENKSMPDELKVFYLSQAQKRKVGDEEYGAGCGKWMEISGYFNKMMNGLASRGFEVYTADQRYLSVLAGTFLVAGFDKESMHVGSVTFSDSRFPEVLCE